MSKKHLFPNKIWQPVAKLTPLITPGISQYSAYRQSSTEKRYIRWHQQVQKPYVTSKSREFNGGQVPESQIASPFNSKTKKPQTSIVLNQSSRPRSCYSCSLSCRCSRTQPSIRFYAYFSSKVSKQISSFAVIKLRDWCISLFFLLHANYREVKATGTIQVLQKLFLQSNKEYCNLFARTLLDHSHSYGFRNSLVSLT